MEIDLGRPVPWTVRGGLWLVIVLAVVLRFWFQSGQPGATGFFFDERIPLENIESILETGSLQPKSYWYQSLSYLPQAALLAASEKLWEVTGWHGFQVRDEGRFLPAAYKICRTSTILFGVLSLLLTFHIGRRLFSAEVGLLGTFLLAVMPWHVFSSARFKPDMLLLLLTLLAFWWVLDLEEQPNTGRFLRAGVGVGLAASAKLNGVLIAIPLVLLGLFLVWREPRRWLGLAWSGVGAAVTFLLFNPWILKTLETLKQNRDYYARVAARMESDHLDVLVRGVTSLFLPQFHGPWMGIAVVAGLVLLGGTVLGRWRGLGSRFERKRARTLAVLFLSFPVAQTLINALATERFKENHVVQLTPFTSLLAAYALMELLGATQRLGGGKRPLATGASLLLAAFVGVNGLLAFDNVYRATVPTTLEMALRTLGNYGSSSELRLLCRESTAPWLEGEAALEWGFAMAQHEDFGKLPPERLDTCDALLFEAERLEAPGAELYLSRLTRTPEVRRKRFEASRFRVRGEELLLLVQDWRTVGERKRLPIQQEEGAWVIELPGCAEQGVFRALEMRVPIRQLSGAWPQPVDGGLEIPWHWAGRRNPGHFFLSERVPCSSHAVILEITFGDPLPADEDLRLWSRQWNVGEEVARHR